MNIKYLLSAIAILMSLGLSAQRKKDLKRKIEHLTANLDSVQNRLIVSQRNEKVYKEKASTLEKEVTELKQANATMMTNLNKFSELSTKNSENVSIAMKALKQKEAQLNSIGEGILKDDSMAMMVMSNMKQTFGSQVTPKSVDGEIVIAVKVNQLLSHTGKVSSSGKEFLQKLAQVMGQVPDIHLTIESLDMTGEFDKAFMHAATLCGILQKEFSIAPEKLGAKAKDGNFTEGINFRFHPGYQAFYKEVNSQYKAGQN